MKQICDPLIGTINDGCKIIEHCTVVNGFGKTYGKVLAYSKAEGKWVTWAYNPRALVNGRPGYYHGHTFNNEADARRDFDKRERRKLPKQPLSQDILERLRLLHDHEPDAPDYDERILKNKSPGALFGELLEWEGIIGYADTILGWVAELYGITLEEGEED